MKKQLGQRLYDKLVLLSDKISDSGYDNESNEKTWARELLLFFSNITNLDTWDEINQQWRNRYNGDNGDLADNFKRANIMWKEINRTEAV